MPEPCQSRYQEWVKGEAEAQVLDENLTELRRKQLDARRVVREQLLLGRSESFRQRYLERQREEDPTQDNDDPSVFKSKAAILSEDITATVAIPQRGIAVDIVNAEALEWCRLSSQRPLGKALPEAYPALVATLPIRSITSDTHAGPIKMHPQGVYEYLVVRAMLTLPIPMMKKMFKRELLSQVQVLCFLADRIRMWQRNASQLPSGAVLAKVVPQGSWADRLLSAGSSDSASVLRALQQGLTDHRTLSVPSESQLSRCLVHALVRDSVRAMGRGAAAQGRKHWGAGVWAHAHGQNPYAEDRTAFIRAHTTLVQGLYGLMCSGGAAENVLSLRRATEEAVPGLSLDLRQHRITSDVAEIGRVCGTVMDEIQADAASHLQRVMPDAKENRGGERYVVLQRTPVALTNGVPSIGAAALAGHTCRVLWRGQGLCIPHELRLFSVEEVELTTIPEGGEAELLQAGWRRSAGKYSPGIWYERPTGKRSIFELESTCTAEIALVGLCRGEMVWLPASLLSVTPPVPGRRGSAEEYWAALDPEYAIGPAAGNQTTGKKGAKVELVGQRKAMRTTRLAMDLLGGGVAQMDKYKNDWMSTGNSFSEHDFIKVLSRRIGRMKRTTATGEELRAQITELFQEIDVDGDQRVDWEEFLDFLVELGRAPSHAISEGMRIEPYEKVNLSSQKGQDISFNLVRMLYHFPLAGWDRLVACADNMVRVYDPLRFGLVSTVPINYGSVLSVAHVPALSSGAGFYGSLVISCADTTLRYISTHDYKEKILKLDRDTSSQTVLKWMPNFGSGGSLLTGSRDGSIYQYPLQTLVSGGFAAPQHESGTGVNVSELNYTRLPILRAKQSRWLNTVPGFSSGEAVTAIEPVFRDAFTTACRDSTIRLWDQSQFRETRALVMHNSGVHSLSYNTEHQLLVSAAGEREPYCWDINISAPPFPLRHDNRPHRAALIGVHCVPNTPQIITGDASGMFKIWDIRTLTPLQTLVIDQSAAAEQAAARRHAISSFCYMENDQRIVTCSSSFHAWEYSRPAGASRNTGGASTAVDVCDAAYNPSQHAFITATGRDLRVWDGRTGRITCVYSEVSATEVTAVATDDRGRKMIIGQHSGTLVMRSAATGLPIRDYQKASSEATAICYIPSRKSVAVACADGAVRVYRDKNGVERPVEVRKAHSCEISCIAHAPTLQLCATADAKKAVILWDAKSWNYVSSITTGNTDQGHLVGEVSTISFLGSRPVVVVADTHGAFTLVTVRPMKKHHVLCRWYNTDTGRPLPPQRSKKQTKTNAPAKTALEVMREEFESGKVDATALLNPRYNALFEALEEERRWGPGGLPGRRLRNLPPLGESNTTSPVPSAAPPRKSVKKGRDKELSTLGHVISHLSNPLATSPITANSAMTDNTTETPKSPSTTFLTQAPDDLGRKPLHKVGSRRLCSQRIPNKTFNATASSYASKHNSTMQSGEGGLASQRGWFHSLARKGKQSDLPSCASVRSLASPRSTAIAPPMPALSLAESTNTAPSVSMVHPNAESQCGAPVVTALVFDPTDEALVSGDDNGIVSVWDLTEVCREGGIPNMMWPMRPTDLGAAEEVPSDHRSVDCSRVRRITTWRATLAPNSRASPVPAVRSLKLATAINCLLVCAEGGGVLLWTPRGVPLGAISLKGGGEMPWAVPAPPDTPPSSPAARRSRVMSSDSLLRRKSSTLAPQTSSVLLPTTGNMGELPSLCSERAAPLPASPFDTDTAFTLPAIALPPASNKEHHR
eukprot:Hpha_TRINITY_DN16643_c0_g1::TRINITY_DN16643_c0_g1_i1::g.181859::m.181859